MLTAKRSATKTIAIRAMIDEVNFMNRECTCPADVRNGWNHLLEIVLHNAKVYSGFGYLEKHQVPAGQKPGVIFDEGHTTALSFPDESRKYYYIHRKLVNS